MQAVIVTTTQAAQSTLQTLNKGHVYKVLGYYPSGMTHFNKLCNNWENPRTGKVFKLKQYMNYYCKSAAITQTD